MIRVLELTTTTAPGGGPRQVYDLARRLPRSEFEVTVAGPRDGPFFERFRALGLTAVEVPTGGPGPAALLATVRLIRKLGIEVVHTHGKGAGLHGRLAARWTGVAAVHTFHGIHYESYRRPLQPLYLGLERRLARWTHTVIHVSPTQAAEARRLGLAGSDPSVTVINGVDLDEQDRRVAASPLSRAGLGLGADWAVLGTVARFDPVKRLDALVDALQFLNRRDVALLLVGDGPEATRLRRRVAATGLGARVVFAGWLDDPARVSPALDLYVAASLKEGLPLAVLEAMGAGLAVVATDVPGHRDVVAAGETGLLVPPGDARALARGIGALLDDPERRARMGRAGRARVAREFALQPMVAKTAEIYRAAATASARSSR